MNRFILLWLLVLTCAIFAIAQTGLELKAQIEGASAGTIIKIPAGIYNVDEIIIPNGVSLEGESHSSVIINASGQNGVKASGSDNISISDLTVTGAGLNGILLENCTKSSVKRVVVKDCLSGITISGGSDNYIAISIVANNRTGIMLSQTFNSSVSNCTVYNSNGFGLSVNSTDSCVFFNNLFSTNSIAVYLGAGNKNLQMDYNLYWGALIGKGRDVPAPTLDIWRSLEEVDYHSIYTEVTLKNPQNNDYSILDTDLQTWRPMLKTDGFGIDYFGSFAAYSTDINGNSFNETIGAYADTRGAYMTRSSGIFTVTKDDAYCSLGVYDENNRLVLWLFTMMPLKVDEYAYWIPSTDMFGAPIVPGTYTVKLTQSNLKLKFVTVGGNDVVNPSNRSSYAAAGVDRVIFDSKSRPVLLLNWSESYEQIRGMNEDMTEQNWSIPGSSTGYGGANDNNGLLFQLRENDGGTYILQQIDEDTGVILADAPGAYGVIINKNNIPNANGIAYINDNVYIASMTDNALYNGYDLRDVIQTLPVPFSPTGDLKRGVIWYVSDYKTIVAVDPVDKVNKVVFQTPFTGIISAAVNGDRMIIVDAHTGQIIRYEITDDGPVEVGRIGTGDGPYGKIQIDRFEFQVHANEKPSKGRSFLANDGKIIVSDFGGVKMFAWDGTPIRSFGGLWFQYMANGADTPGSSINEIVDVVSNKTIHFDNVNKTSSWGTYYEKPRINERVDYMHLTTHFMHDGIRYSYFFGNRFDSDATNRGSVILLVKYNEGGHSEIVWGMTTFENLWCERYDFSNETLSNPADWYMITTTEGISLTGALPAMLTSTYNADLFMTFGRGVYKVSCKEFIDGAPVFDWDNVMVVPFNNGTPNNQLISPYDLITPETPGFGRYISQLAGGTYVSNPSFRTGNNSGFANWGGSSLGGYAEDGTLRWIQPITVPDSQGVKPIDNLGYSVSTPLQQFQVINNDGALVGVLGTPQGIFWNGMWLDNSFQYIAFKGADNTHYAVIGNFNDSTSWICEVVGANDIEVSDNSLTLTEEWYNAWNEHTPRIDTLWHRPPNATSNMIVKKLNDHIPIDGDLEKWREILPTPQVIITPETVANIDGPKDASALMRFAYVQGDGIDGYLYVQLIRFDNVVAMHQPAEKFYKQDALEIALNSFLEGVKINVTHTIDQGDVVIRDGWFLQAKSLSSDDAQRKITVYEDASSITEKKILEDIYGIDMSDCYAVVSEFVIPLNDDTFSADGRSVDRVIVKSGGSFHLGIAIDDNDAPGADIQKMFVWPSTYITFANKSVSAEVFFE